MAYPKSIKKGIHMRPRISYVYAPTYRLAKFLDAWFKLLVDFTIPPLWSPKSNMSFLPLLFSHLL